MQSHARTHKQQKDKKSKWQTQWEKIGKRLPGLYRYRKSGMYYARVRKNHKVHGRCPEPQCASKRCGDPAAFARWRP